MASSANLSQRRKGDSSSSSTTGMVSSIRQLEDMHKSSSKTITWAQLPEWMQDNEHITTGYRRVQNSWRGCIESVYGYLHNETVNIHTHLLGTLLFVFILSSYQSTVLARYDTTTWIDAAAFAAFLCTAVFCLMSSSFYHTVGCHSEEVAVRCHALDYSGIIALIVGSNYPCVYYGFFCDPFFQLLFFSTITIAGAAAAFVVLSPEYSKPTHRGARTAVFMALGLCSFLPITQGLYMHGFQTLGHDMGFKWLAVSGTLYISGGLVYANRVPERLSPGTFDYFFASHQIFHVQVVLAALAHYQCVLTAFEHAHGRLGGICTPTFS